MSIPSRVRLFVLLAAIAALSTSALGQSQNELRRDNERLRGQIATLTQDIADVRQALEDAKLEIARLELELALARSGSHGSTSATAPDPVPVTIDETKPDASPRALLAALMTAYQGEMSDRELGSSPTDPERVAYLRLLQRWVQRMNREHRAPIEWHARMVGMPVSVGRGFAARFQAVDPETGAALGDAFDGLLPRSVRLRLIQMRERGELADELVIKGTLVPRLLVNEERLAEGPFNNPRIVGPFVEFAFFVSIQSVTLAPEKQDAQATPTP